MSRLPRTTGKALVAALQSAGFKVIRVTGSHHHLHKIGSNLVTVPVHAGEILSPIIIKSVLKQAGLDVDDLIKLL
ncbi:MAG: type II toxin-antitoxin system HicA family toxin [Desulfosporosinus sp.]